MEKIKLDIYCGMLGSGKTTLIRQMLKTAYQGSKAAVIENEIGTINLDSELLKQTSVTVREVTSGCICCTMKGNLTAAIRLLSETEKPDYIIIEPSGAADLAGVIQAALDAENIILNRVIMLVNARKITKLLKIAGDFLFRELKIASTVYLNFSEFISAEELDAAKDAVLEVNPGLKIVSVPMCEINGDVFPDEMFSETEQSVASFTVSDDNSLPAGTSALSRNLSAASSGSGNMTVPANSASEKRTGLKMRPDSRNFTMTYHFSLSCTESLLHALKSLLRQPKYDCIWRAKGYLPADNGTMTKIDYVYGDWYYEAMDAFSETKAGRIVFIGKNIPVTRLKKALDSLQNSILSPEPEKNTEDTKPF